MNTNELIIEAVKGDISWEECLKLSPKEDVFIDLLDLLPMLNRYLSKNITATELQEWASWVISLESLCVKGWEIESTADYYEPMWNCLQELSTPFLDGAISKNKVENYVSILTAL